MVELDRVGGDDAVGAPHVRRRQAPGLAQGRGLRDRPGLRPSVADPSRDPVQGDETGPAQRVLGRQPTQVRGTIDTAGADRPRQRVAQVQLGRKQCVLEAARVRRGDAHGESPLTGAGERTEYQTSLAVAARAVIPQR